MGGGGPGVRAVTGVGGAAVQGRAPCRVVLGGALTPLVKALVDEDEREVHGQ